VREKPKNTRSEVIEMEKKTTVINVNKSDIEKITSTFEQFYKDQDYDNITYVTLKSGEVLAITDEAFRAIFDAMHSKDNAREQPLSIRYLVTEQEILQVARDFLKCKVSPVSPHDIAKQIDAFLKGC
jgi:Zn finger protein HypA/HybF involved in hydrogenase expression